MTEYGPWGLGGMQVPNRGKVYSPPTADETTREARDSPRWEGSKVISKLTSVPPLEPGAAVMDLSQWKSLESV